MGSIKETDLELGGRRLGYNVGHQFCIKIKPMGKGIPRIASMSQLQGRRGWALIVTKKWLVYAGAQSVEQR